MSIPCSNILQLRLEKVIDRFCREFPDVPVCQVLGILSLVQADTIAQLEQITDEDDDTCDDYGAESFV